MKNNSKYQTLRERISKITDLGFAHSVLSWDQQTYMPKNGGAFRGQQMATIQSLAHEQFVDSKTGDLLRELLEDSSLGADERLNVELTLKDYNRKKKYPQSFVEEMAKLTSDAFMSWHVAKAANKFSDFAPFLNRIIELKIQETEFLGYENHPYEALLEDFEPGLTVKKIDEVFTDVKAQLFPFIKEIAKKAPPRRDFLERHYPKAKQIEVSEQLLKQMGYDFHSGRADFTPHPFCTTFGPGDVRVTLWCTENYLPAMVFAAIHEGGHALYELGLPLSEHYGLPLGQATSMAFHESQSRFWENSIARSLPYWKQNFKTLHHVFPENLKDVSIEEFYKSVNVVRPSFVRVEADELTYHAHIYIRYLIEKALIEKQIKVEDIPEFWNDRYEEFLGIRPKTDTEGCLQDVHWCYGAFGYFPTYSLGSFYAAQFSETIKNVIPNHDVLIESGDLAPILQWLRTNVHAHGRRYRSNEILKRTTGEELNIRHFMNYARNKYGSIYGI